MDPLDAETVKLLWATSSPRARVHAALDSRPSYSPLPDGIGWTVCGGCGARIVLPRRRGRPRKHCSHRCQMRVLRATWRAA
jgi:hypothetical protein